MNISWKKKIPMFQWNYNKKLCFIKFIQEMDY